MKPSLLGAVPLVLLAAGSLHAGVIPGRWEKVDALTSGNEIIVTLKGGDRIEGLFRSSAADSLSLMDASGQERRLPKAEVRRIVGGKRYDDPILDGTVIGILAGLAGGFAAGAAIYHGQGGEKPEASAFIAPVGAFGAGVGALVGFLADRSHKGNELLYEAAR